MDAITGKITVSVIIPAYNTAQYVGEALDSVFAQTFKDFEVIVINDGSPDTEQLEHVLEPYLDRIVYLKQENRGPSAARNAGIRRARGEYVAFLDSDDIWLPDYLAAQVSSLEGRTNLVASIADMLLFGGAQGESVWKMAKDHGLRTLNFEQVLRREGGQNTTGTLARRRRVVEAGMYDEKLRWAEDFNLLAKICYPDGAIGYLGRALVKYRRHDGSLTSDTRNRNWQVGEVQALRRLGETLALQAQHRRILEEEIAAAEAALKLDDAYDHLARHDLENGALCLRQANTYYHDPRITLALAGLKAFPTWTVHWLNRRRERSHRTRQV